MRARPVILEPVMAVEVRAPTEFQGGIIGDLNRRKGIIVNTEGTSDEAVMQAQVCCPFVPSHALALDNSFLGLPPLIACIAHVVST